MGSVHEEATASVDSPTDGSGEAKGDLVRTIKVGWIIAGRMDQADYDALKQSRSAALDMLNQAYSEFSWRMPLIHRPELVSGRRAEPVALLELGVTERELHRLDFGLLITPVDLVSHYKPFALATVSRSLDLAVISTARIDPLAENAGLPRKERVQLMADRLQALVLHSLGHLCGLKHYDEPANIMFDIQTVEDLQRMRQMEPAQLSLMRDNLQQVADLRLEEQKKVERKSAWKFYIRGASLNRHEIVDAVWQARPWQFPARFSRMTTAAVSAAMILLITAETWDLAASQSMLRIAILVTVSLLVTTVFIISRQQLLVHRRRRILTEQTVITNLATTAVVFVGMITTFCLLFALTLALSFMLFSVQLAGEWAASLEQTFSLVHYFKLATVIAGLAGLIGALGASFEEYYHFRHITFIDEET